MAASPNPGRVRDPVDIDDDGGGVHGTDHLANATADAAIQNDGQGAAPGLVLQADGRSRRTLIGIPGGWRASGALGEADLDGALAQAEIAELQIVRVIRHGDGQPAIHGLVAQQAGKIGPPGLTPEALAPNRQAGLGPRQPGQAHARLARVVDVMGEGAGGAGQDALQAIAGEVAGLVAGLDVGRADSNPVGQIGEADGLDGTDLDALTALDAGGEKFLLLEPILDRARRPQAGIGLTRQGQQARQGGTQYPDSQEGGADEFPAILFAPLGAEGRARRGGSLLL